MSHSKRDQLAQQFMPNNTCHILLIPSDAMQRENHCMAVPGISSFIKADFSQESPITAWKALSTVPGMS